jgi:hypothetical protein
MMFFSFEKANFAGVPYLVKSVTPISPIPAALASAQAGV